MMAPPERRRAAVLLCLLVGACTRVENPMPSPVWDGLYVGTRHSDRPEKCGVSRPEVRTTATIRNGEVSIPLFSSQTMLTGTVDQNGRVRASGIWPNPTHGFPGETVLNGQIGDHLMEGMATDFRCETMLRLHKAPLPEPKPVRHPAPHRKPHRKPPATPIS